MNAKEDVLFCIPGARHTNNKKIFDYLNNQTKKKHFPVRVLSRVYDIEPLVGGGSQYNYRIYYNDYGPGIGNRQALLGVLVRNHLNSI